MAIQKTAPDEPGGVGRSRNWTIRMSIASRPIVG